MFSGKPNGYNNISKAPIDIMYLFFKPKGSKHIYPLLSLKAPTILSLMAQHWNATVSPRGSKYEKCSTKSLAQQAYWLNMGTFSLEARNRRDKPWIPLRLETSGIIAWTALVAQA